MQKQQLLQPTSKEHALQILKQGFQQNEVRNDGRFSFNERKSHAHPKVRNIFESPKRQPVFEPPRVFTVRQARKITCQNFQIPTLPQGRMLKIKILSNWGDKLGVGLNGIELFDSMGGNITRYVKMAEQEDLLNKNKLIDGFQAVQDDNHIWVSRNLKAEIVIDLIYSIRVSMLRIWNYNKSRIHAYKGVRKLQISLDSKLIFQGSIRKATGDLKRFQENCEYILFTTDDKIINRMSDQDWLNQRVIDYSNQHLLRTFSERPRTGYKKQEHPQTQIMAQRQDSQRLIVEKQNQNQKQKQNSIPIKDLILEFTSRMRGPYGLNRLILVDSQGNIITQDDIIESNLSDFDFQKLLNLQNIYTNDPYFMIWLKNKKIEIKFKTFKQVSQIKVYNYNENVTDSLLTGPDLVRLQYNGKTQIQYLRPGPCVEGIDYGQTIYLNSQSNLSLEQEIKQNYQFKLQYPFITYPPCGMLITIYLVSTYGDTHYVGLNGLEIYNNQGIPLLHSNKIPYQIYSYPELKNDPRIVKNLTFPPYDNTCLPQQSYLSPYINTPFERLKNNSSLFQSKNNSVIHSEKQEINKLLILFEKQIQFSAIDFYNYSKTPNRGAKEVHIHINNKLIYQGCIRQCFNDINRTTILFSDNQEIMSYIQPQLYQSQNDQVMMINEGEYLTNRKHHQIWNQDILIRPNTCIQK